MHRAALPRTGLAALAITVVVFAAAGCTSDPTEQASSVESRSTVDASPASLASPLAIADGRSNTWTAPDGTVVSFVAVVPPTRLAHDRLAALGIDSELVIVPGEGHIIESLTAPQLWAALDR